MTTPTHNRRRLQCRERTLASAARCGLLRTCAAPGCGRQYSDAINGTLGGRFCSTTCREMGRADGRGR